MAVSRNAAPTMAGTPRISSKTTTANAVAVSGSIRALGPLFVFLFQIVEGRVSYAPATMTGPMIYFAWAVLAAYGGAKHVRRMSIGGKRKDIAIKLDRELAKLDTTHLR
ncbi:hypothetical protein [Aquamicrobium sp. LC103]|uniref:hypothetical protein n=1 Tax=Aquamicrobium sp. LC103 TaxID=1120658 RepID=UPI00063E97C1|nr:hypothetical protein [Aquamicrobium sp. LC103]TKT69548.1 hypothetical protein XW59_027450 [Aquamicrobium sp. LC103]